MQTCLKELYKGEKFPFHLICPWLEIGQHMPTFHPQRKKENKIKYLKENNKIPFLLLFCFPNFWTR